MAASSDHSARGGQETSWVWGARPGPAGGGRVFPAGELLPESGELCARPPEPPFFPLCLEVLRL